MRISPPHAHEERGKEVDIRGYVDSNLARENKTRRSRYWFFVFFNTSLIQWFYKKQATIYTSVFEVEFVAINMAMETLRRISYKLRMMGVLISGPLYIYGDNILVIHNTQRPESNLNKKSNSIC